MGYVCGLEQVRRTDREWAGEKAALLGELMRAGVEVPEAFCVSAAAYADALAENGLDREIQARLKQAEIDDPVELEAAAEDIRNRIEQAPVPARIAAEIEGARGRLKGKADLAVRVSRVVEDVINPRASGLVQAFLAVKPAAVLDCVRRIWSTPWTSRAIYYRQRKKMDHRQVTVAVIVQRMAQADAAGVMFTGNPLTASPTVTLAPDEIHIDATWGLGEALNEARWHPDHWTIGKADLAIRTREVALKNMMQVVAPEGGLEMVTVAAERQNTACLSDAQAIALATMGKQIEAHLKETQDMDWAREGDRFLMLQTRALKKK